MPRSEKGVVSSTALQMTMEAAKNAKSGAKPQGLPEARPDVKTETKTKPKKQSKTKSKASASGVVRPKREKSGRNYPFNQSVTPDTAQRFYDMQAELGVTMGEVLERAIKALEKSRE